MFENLAQECLEQCLLQMEQLVLEHSWLVNFSANDYFDMQPLPVAWTAFLQHIPQEDRTAFLIDLAQYRVPRDAPACLSNFIKSCNRMSFQEERNQASAPFRSDKLPPGVNPKKQHEVSATLAFLRDEALDSACDLAIEVGSGKVGAFFRPLSRI